jgi:hypothetical protein
MLPSQVRLHASVFYLGSALFLATGVVSIADQPLGSPPHNGPPNACSGCDGPDDNGVYCSFQGDVCTDSNNKTCDHCKCYVTPEDPPGACYAE